MPTKLWAVSKIQIFDVYDDGFIVSGQMFTRNGRLGFVLSSRAVLQLAKAVVETQQNPESPRVAMTRMQDGTSAMERVPDSPVARSV